MSALIAYRWTGDSFEPLPRFVKECDREFTIGEVYRLTTVEERSAKSHAHYFAMIVDAWSSLPETIAAQYPTPEHLRKKALIAAGFYDCATLVCASRAEALRVAAFMRPVDEFSIITVIAATVHRFVAKSQSMKAMGKEQFQKSKEATLDQIAAMIGTTTQTLSQNAKEAA